VSGPSSTPVGGLRRRSTDGCTGHILPQARTDRVRDSATE
jgi:hypothetical protein